MTTQPAVEIPSIVLEALDKPQELVDLLFERVRVDVARLSILCVSKARIVQESGLGSRMGLPPGVKTKDLKNAH